MGRSASRNPLRRRTVLITGPARGIGAASAREAVRRGANVSLVGLEPERLAALAGEAGDRAAWYEADVTDAAAVRDAIETTAERFGRIDAVVTNAGIARVGTVEGIDPSEFEQVVEVNLLGTFRTVHAALPHLRAARGYVLCIASVAAGAHLPLMASYAASKAGVEAFGNVLRSEVAAQGIDVGVAYFGFVDTDMVRDAFAHPLTAAITDRMPEMMKQQRLTVDVAARAIVDGIARRARTVVRPRYLAPVVHAPGLVRPLLDWFGRRADVTAVGAVSPPRAGG